MISGPKRFAERCSAASIVALFVLVAVVSVPAAAYAEVWTSQYPFGTVHLQPDSIGVDLFGTAAVNARTAVIKVDGVARKTYVTQGAASGHWTYTETLVDGQWTINWTWVADTGGSTKATIFCYPGTLADGLHTAAATVRDVNGRTWSTQWSFTLAVGPAFASPIPAPNTTVKTATPAISVKVSDNAGIANTVATVNGVAATTAYANGLVTVGGFGTLPDGSVTVAVTATDSDGNSTSKTWTFKVSTVDQTCTSVGCHSAAYIADPAMGPNCTECHPDRATPHGYDAAKHTASIDASAMAGVWTMALEPSRTHAGVPLNPPYVYSTGCTKCHDPGLAVEHGKATSQPANASVCADCHPSPRDSIVGAWDKSCTTAGCHTAAGHSHPATATLADHSLAASLTTESPAGVGCSASPGGPGYVRTPCHTTDLIQEHNRKIGGFAPYPTQVITKTIAVTCEQCHASAAYAALKGSWDGTCNACHDGVTMQNHSIVGTARYDEVHALHQAPRYYDSGDYSRTGTLKAGINSMDAHGPVRTDTAISPIPYGCANQLCHLGFYIEAGLSSYYAANSCATCHGPNIVPLAPYQGSYMWKSGSWTDGADLVTALTLDLGVALPAMSSLDFKSYYDIESGWDYGYVQVSTDGGGSWASLAGSVTTTTNPNGRNLGNGITGASAGWADAHFDLSAYAGQTVKIRFNYVTDAYVYGEGWFIDVVSLGPAGAPLFSDDVETLKPEWTVTSNRTTRWSR